MKSRMRTVVIVIIIIAILVLAGWYVLYMYWGIGPMFPFMQGKVIEMEMPSGEVSEAEPLMALTEDEETAKSIAEQYGITFVSFQEGVATYHTDEDLWEVIDRGEANGYPPLYINRARTLYDS